MNVVEKLHAYKKLTDQISEITKKRDSIKEDLIKELEKAPLRIGDYEVGVQYCLVFDKDKYRAEYPLTYLHFMCKREKMIIVRGKNHEEI